MKNKPRRSDGRKGLAALSIKTKDKRWDKNQQKLWRQRRLNLNNNLFKFLTTRG